MEQAGQALLHMLVALLATTQTRLIIHMLLEQLLLLHPLAELEELQGQLEMVLQVAVVILERLVQQEEPVAPELQLMVVVLLAVIHLQFQIHI